MRVTEKGQVTIPKEVRDRLGIRPGSEVDFIASGNGAMLVKIAEASEPAIRDFDDWLERVRGMIDLDGMTTDEFMEFLRGPRDDVDPR
ncbi:AbrB/MazE/SpoVT family DNA-binding domain-containing protein [Rhizobium sp. A37_96]